jgi:SAM-dependent methyltransferase
VRSVDVNANQKQRARLESFLADKLPIARPLKVLEAGCGATSNVTFPDESIVIGIDQSEKQLRRNTHLQHKILGDLQTYEFRPESFDVVVCWNVLEHVSDVPAVLSRISSSLAPGGLVIVASPNLWSIKGLVTRLTPHSFHVWFYRRILNRPSAGIGDVAPFPTVLSRAMSPGELRSFAADKGYRVLWLETYEGNQQALVREKYPPVSLAFRAIGLLSSTVTSGRVNLAHSDYIVVLQRPLA